VGVVRDAVVGWMVGRPSGQPWALPVVTETYDGLLNDVNGFHVKPEHVVSALEGARSGPVAEGGVGGGTGMICFDFKGGIGTSSRKLDAKDGGYTVGVLVQANMGKRSELRIAGVPVGREIPDLVPCASDSRLAEGFAAELPPCEGSTTLAPSARGGRTGSIIVVVATDAPLIP
ncbi:MAG: P1 family peptidase, partial [Chthoniobacterales bacterium]